MGAAEEWVLEPLEGETFEDYAARAAAEVADVDDLIRLVNGSGYVNITEEGATVATGAGGDEDGAEDEQRQPPAPLRSVMERAEGDLERGFELAEWLFGLRAEAEREISTFERRAERNIEQAKAWRDKQIGRFRRTIAWIDWLLTSFHRDSGERRIELPNGLLNWRKATAESVWDEDAALQFALQESRQAGKAVIDGGGTPEAAMAAAGATMAELLTVRKDSLKDRLLQEGPTYYYVTEQGEKVAVITKHEKGEVPASPGDPQQAAAWCKPGETYTQVLKGA